MGVQIDEHSLISKALPGVMDHGQGRVTFAIYAPGKKSVHLAGTFNGWDWRGDRMTDRGGGFWVIEKRLEPGRHEYLYVIDENLYICDPYAQEVEYKDEVKNYHAVIRVGEEPYRWEHEDWQRPAFRDLIVYELHVGDYSPEGTFRGLADRLDYLKELGVNAIELMPIYETSLNDYWGYEPMFFFSARRQFGTAEDLKYLIDQAHGKGIAVLLDIVLAHTANEHPFNQMYAYEQSPWYGEATGEQNQFGLPTLDYRKDTTNSFVRDVQYYWLTVFHFDGFRYDYLAALASERKDQGMPYLIRTAREVRPEIYLIGEYIPERPDLVNNSGLDGVWHARIRLALHALLGETEIVPYRWNDFEDAIRAIDPSVQEYKNARMMINYLECHDDRRMMEIIQSSGSDETVAALKVGLAATALVTAPGQPMLYQGQELGEEQQERMQKNPMRWELLETERGSGLHDHYQKLCRLRREHGSLRSNNFKFGLIDASKRCAVYFRWSGQADQVVTAVNFSGDRQKIDVPFRRSGRWRELFSEETVEVEKSRECDLGPWSAKVFYLDI